MAHNEVDESQAAYAAAEEELAETQVRIYILINLSVCIPLGICDTM